MEEKVLDKQKGLIYSLYDIDMRQVSQDEAQYNPIGMTSERACANCNWFVPGSDACVIVAGDIVPTGISKFWLEKFVYTPDPMPVIIVKDEAKGPLSSLYSHIAETMKTLWPEVRQSVITAEVQKQVIISEQPNGFTTFRDKEDNLRFFGWGSNNFKDKHKEIIPEIAHKEFVEWCDTTKTYPELWLWHVPGTKYGQIDMLDTSDGFLVLSGTIDKDKEAIAEAQANLGVGMSHGMKCIIQKDGTIVLYRSYEFSTLPMDSTAAIPGSTGFEILSEGDEMGFSEKKKTFLKQVGFSDEQVVGFETKTAEMSASLKALGYEWKEGEDAGTVLPAGVVNISIKEELAPFLQTQGQLIEAVTVMAAKLKELQVSDDEKIATVFTAKFAEMKEAFSPTSSAKNLTQEKQEDRKKDDGWFGDVMANVLDPMGASK